MDALLFALGAIGSGVLCAITGYILGVDKATKRMMKGVSAA